MYTTPKPTCEARKGSGWKAARCTNAAKFYEVSTSWDTRGQELHFCGTHAPSQIAKRQEATRQANLAERARINAALDSTLIRRNAVAEALAVTGGEIKSWDVGMEFRDGRTTSNLMLSIAGANQVLAMAERIRQLEARLAAEVTA